MISSDSHESYADAAHARRQEPRGIDLIAALRAGEHAAAICSPRLPHEAQQ